MRDVMAEEPSGGLEEPALSDELLSREKKMSDERAETAGMLG